MKSSYATLLSSIHNLSKKLPLIFIGIDGCGGVGKTTLSKQLSEKLQHVTVVHMDEFDLPYKDRIIVPIHQKAFGADTDYKRLLRQVMYPLKKLQSSRYQRYSWDNDRMEEWIDLWPQGIIVVEGVYAIRSELSPLYDLRVWLECPTDIRLERGLKRDGEVARDRWITDWLPMEERYLTLDNPMQRADIILQTG